MPAQPHATQSPTTPSGSPSRRPAAAIVPAAGRGERLGGGTPKALRTIGGVPLLVHAVRGLVDSGRIDLVVVAAPPGGEAEVRGLLAEFGARVLVVGGGATRQQSVALALDAVPATVDTVLVHDAARALTPPTVVAAVADALAEPGVDAVIPVLPVADTIKAVDPTGRVTATVDRSALRAVQTPQGFRRSVLAAAHEAHAHGQMDEALAATDDAGLVERLGGPVTVVPGDPEAFKVTTPFDLLIAEAVYARREAAANEAVNANGAAHTASGHRNGSLPHD